ncbi:MAG TPA: hypothetical protein VIR77_05245 [Pontiella sp.]
MAALTAFLPLCLCVLLLSSCKPKPVIESQDHWSPDTLTFSISTPGGTIHVGDHYEVTFTAIYPTNGIVTFPDIGREKDIVVLNRQWREIPFDPEEGYKKEEVRYTITSFRIGDHLICDKPAVYQHDGLTETNRVPETTISVVSSLDDRASSELADIKPPHRLPGRIPVWLWLTAGTALAAFLIGLISSGLWKNREQLIPSAPPVPPHVIALKALAALSGKGLLQKGECNPFYTELSMILRTYLEGRFHLNAPDETTEEIVEEISRSPELTGAQRNILQAFMRQADMVKFARGESDRETMQAAFNTAKQFIEQTKQPDDTAAKSSEVPANGEPSKKE